MCGKAHFPVRPDAIVDSVRGAYLHESDPSITERDRKPGAKAFIVLDHKENPQRRVVTPFSWGFAGTYNARVETAESRAVWKGPFGTQRCLVPVYGFFEGRGDGEYYISSPDDSLFFLAGLWRRSPLSSDVREFAVLTQDSNSQLSGIHARMPCVIDPINIDEWLSRDVRDGRAIRSMAIHAPPYKVTKAAIGE